MWRKGLQYNNLITNYNCKLKYEFITAQYCAALYSIPSETNSHHAYMHAAVKRTNYTTLLYSLIAV